jgi:hypothetical protein
MMNKLKVMQNSTSIYTPSTPSSKKTFQETSNVYVAHFHPYVPMCELWVN